MCLDLDKETRVKMQFLYGTTVLIRAMEVPRMCKCFNFSPGSLNGRRTGKPNPLYKARQISRMTLGYRSTVLARASYDDEKGIISWPLLVVCKH